METKGVADTWNLSTTKQLKIHCGEQHFKAPEKSILEKYDTDWIERTGGMRYQRELSSGGSAEDINKAFPRELSRSTNTRNSTWGNLISLWQDYNRKYIMGYGIKAESNDAYDDAWLERSENKLPEYLTRIEDTRKKAFEQFREDFLSRLENNISDAHRQIDGLNTAVHNLFTHAFVVKQYPPSCAKSRNDNWDILSTFFAYPAALWKMIYTTNIIEGLNRQFRKATKNKPSFINDDSLRKMLYPASKRIIEHWTVSCRNWEMVLNRLNIMFADRISA